MLKTFHSTTPSKSKVVVPFSLHFKLLIVIGVVTINSCNPQMLRCVLCYFFVMQVDVRNLFQGKNKGF